MSWEAQAWVWSLKLKANLKWVLMGIANYADQTGKAYPSLTVLSDKLGLSKPALISNIAELEKIGVLEKSRDSRFGNNVYQLKSLKKPSKESLPPSKESLPDLVKNLKPGVVKNLKPNLPEKPNKKPKEVRTGSAPYDKVETKKLLDKANVIAKGRKNRMQGLCQWIYDTLKRGLKDSEPPERTRLLISKCLDSIDRSEPDDQILFRYLNGTYKKIRPEVIQGEGAQYKRPGAKSLGEILTAVKERTGASDQTDAQSK